MPEPIINWAQKLMVPNIPKPAKREEPVVELLVEQHHAGPQAQRVQMRKPPEEIVVPRFNRLYGTLKSKDGWRYVIDNYAKGTITTVANTTVVVQVTLANQPNWLLERWPAATQLYLCIRRFGIAPQTAPATVGSIDCLFLDNSGNVMLLGDYPSNAGGNQEMAEIIPSARADPGETNVGALQVLLNTGATAATYYWQMAFSAAYLIPDLIGYERVQRGGGMHGEPIHRDPD